MFLLSATQTMGFQHLLQIAPIDGSPHLLINCPNSPEPIVKQFPQWSQFQHITYNEWLPLVLGASFMDELDILPLTQVSNNKASDWSNKDPHWPLIGRH